MLGKNAQATDKLDIHNVCNAQKACLDLMHENSNEQDNIEYMISMPTHIFVWGYMYPKGQVFVGTC